MLRANKCSSKACVRHIPVVEACKHARTSKRHSWLAPVGKILSLSSRSPRGLLPHYPASTGLWIMKMAPCAALSGCATLGSQAAPPLASPLAAARPRLAAGRPGPVGLRRVQCSVAGDVTTAPSTSGRDSGSSSTGGGQPPSWPSAAARSAAYGATARQPAQEVPATMIGTLPAWLKGRYIRNGPGDLTVTVGGWVGGRVLGGGWWVGHRGCLPATYLLEAPR